MYRPSPGQRRPAPRRRQQVLEVGGEFEDETIAPQGLTDPNDLVHSDPDLAASKDEVDAELTQAETGPVEPDRHRNRRQRRKHGRNR